MSILRERQVLLIFHLSTPIDTFLKYWLPITEPNSYTHKTGVTLTPEQIGDAFLTLQSLLKQSKWWDQSLMLGPDANRIYTSATDRFLSR